MPFDVPAQGVEMLGFLNRKGLEPAVGHVAGSHAVPVRVPAVGVRQRQPACEPGRLPVLAGPHEQIPMVREQTLALFPLDV